MPRPRPAVMAVILLAAVAAALRMPVAPAQSLLPATAAPAGMGPVVVAVGPAFIPLATAVPLVAMVAMAVPV